MFLNVPSFAAGFVAGFGTGFISREVARVGVAGLRPVTKSVIKSGMLAVERCREALSIAGETFEDLVAEARADMANKPRVSASGAGAESKLPAQDDSESSSGSKTVRKKGQA